MLKFIKQKLKERLLKLRDSADLEEGRLELEVAILSDKLDITEELVRMSSHLNLFREVLGTPPHGKKLDFALQEIVRELNTIASKAQNSEIQSLVVEAKGEAERIKEQVQKLRMRIRKGSRHGMILSLIGPAGSGKTTLCASLVDKFPGEIKLSVSVTSRSIREGEVDGKNYQFVSREEFEKMRDEDKFFEWEEVHGNFYGTLKSTVEETLLSGEDLLLAIDIRGALNFKKTYPKHTVLVFIAVPSFELLLERLKNRGDISAEELNKRLATTKAEYQKILELHQSGSGIDYVLVNDDIQDAQNALVEIRNAEVARFQRINSDLLKEFCRIEE